MTPSPISWTKVGEHDEIEAVIAFAACQQFDQRQRQENRHRIIGAGS